jgi:hypothetical protein
MLVKNVTVEPENSGLAGNGVSQVTYLRRGKPVRFWTLSTKLPIGFKGSRFAVEMTWALGPEISADQLEHWEATLTRFLKSFPLRKRRGTGDAKRL